MPDHSQKTLRIYEACLKRLRDHFHSSDLSFLNNSDDVIAMIEGLEVSDNTKKIYFIAVKSTLRDIPEKSEVTKKAEKAYQAKMDEFNRRAYEKMERQELDEREKALWINWRDVIKAREKAYDTATDIHSFQDYVILALYTMLPPARLDYSPMRVVSTLEGNSEGNLLLVSQTGMEFIMREYKTAKKYGQRIIKVSKPLEKVLRDWLELNPSGWLLCTQDGLPMTEESLSRRIRTIFERLVGKSVGVNILRHSFVSFLRKGEPSLKHQKEVANVMGHSISMSQLYKKQY